MRFFKLSTMFFGLKTKEKTAKKAGINKLRVVEKAVLNRTKKRPSSPQEWKYY